MEQATHTHCVYIYLFNNLFIYLLVCLFIYSSIFFFKEMYTKLLQLDC